MPLFIGLGMAGAGVAKSELIDRPKEARQRKLAAATQRYSPWTGMSATAPQETDPAAAALSYGSQGAMLGQNIDNANTSNQLMKDQSQWMNQYDWNNKMKMLANNS